MRKPTRPTARLITSCTTWLLAAGAFASDQRHLVDMREAPAMSLEEIGRAPDYYLRLQTLLLEGENKCLEGNQLAEDSMLSGASYQDDCEITPGQLWKIIPAESKGYYRLQTLFLEENDQCLEGNRRAEDSVLGGAAFMDGCQNVSGQLWKFVDAGSGYYRLQTKLSEANNKCLEGNRVGSGSVLGGAAFMDDCQNVSGQLWKIIRGDGSGADSSSGQDVTDADAEEEDAEEEEALD